MSRRLLSASIVLSASLSITTGLVWSAPSVDSVTDAAAGTEIENSKFQFEGEVNANAVYVRSGPSDNDYATAKLDKGSKVTVVGIKFDWLKVMPPEGSFCYVAKAYVEKRGDGTVGRVTNTLNVRVGSNLLPMKTKVAAKLEPGQDVLILGEQDEYFKVKPPAGVYFYINKQFVDPVRRVDIPGLAADEGAADKPVAPTTPVADAERKSIEPAEVNPSADAPPGGQIESPPGVADAGQKPPTTNMPPANGEPANSGVALTDLPGDTGSGTTPATQPAVAAVEPSSPTTQPNASLVSADIRFDELEEKLKEAARLPIEQQPVPELLAGYQSLVGELGLPDSMRRIAEHRLQTLKTHNENYELALAHQRQLQDREAAIQAKKAESEELMERLKTTGIVFYAAVGTVRASTLQGADQTLYRLTDPISGRTVIYLKSNDPSLARINGLFVGVQGEVQDDPAMKLRFITPTEITPVDQRAVHRNVTARIVPPSLLPGGALAGSGQE